MFWVVVITPGPTCLTFSKKDETFHSGLKPKVLAGNKESRPGNEMNLGPVMEGWQHLRLVSDAQYISLGKTMWRLSYRSVPCTASSFQPKVALESVSSPLGLIDKPAGSLGLRRLSAASGSSSRASRSQVPMSQGRSREG